jgi:hypothetical protein
MLKPQDIVLATLLAHYSRQRIHVKQVDLAAALGMTPSAVSVSLTRLRTARVLEPDGHQVVLSKVYELLGYVLPYLAPTEPGRLISGIPTAHTAPPLNAQIQSDETYVWPKRNGTHRGQRIQPLMDDIPKLALKNEWLYQVFALVDAIRVGKAREITLARTLLEKLLK